MKHVIAFLLGFIIIRLYYFIFIIRKNMKYNEKKVPSEVSILMHKYKLDMKKINYVNLMKTISLINSIIIGIVSLVGSFFNRVNIDFLVSIILIIPCVIVSYMLLGKYLVKKGLSKNV